jgi:hypothetical protein
MSNQKKGVQRFWVQGLPAFSGAEGDPGSWLLFSNAPNFSWASFNPDHKSDGLLKENLSAAELQNLQPLNPER